MMEKLFAVCAPGLEPLTARELEELCLKGSRSLAEDSVGEDWGGVEFEGSLDDIYRTNLHLRTASRVLVRLGEFYAAGFPELRRKAGRLPWEDYLRPERAVALRVTCRQSRLYHEGAVAERLSGAIADRLGKPPSLRKYHEETEADPPQLIVVRLVSNLCTISIDSSGELLHRRGYRFATGKAPLRETLASGLVMASGWNGTSPLLDPFCGSGTIPIEAALLARKVPPGENRRFAFMDWPHFDLKIWNALLAEARRGMLSVTPSITASDRDAGAIQAARANAERAGVENCIDFSCRAISAIDPPAGPGWVVTNPPYGVRLSQTGDLRNLYAQFGKVLRTRCSGWSVTLLCRSLRMIRGSGLKCDQWTTVVSGGLKRKMVTCRV